MAGSGKFANAWIRQGSPALDDLKKVFQNIQDNAQKENSRNQVYNYVNQFQNDIQNAQKNATIPGQPASTANIPALLASPAVRATGTPQSSSSGISPYLPDNPVTPTPQSNDFVSNLLNKSSDGAIPVQQSSTPQPDSYQTITPAVAPKYNPVAQEQAMANMNVNLMKNLGQIQNINPEDQKNALNIASILNSAYQPSKPQLLNIPEKNRLISLDPLNPSNAETILDEKPDPKDNVYHGVNGTYPIVNGKIDFAHPTEQKETGTAAMKIGNDGFYYDWNKKSNAYVKTNLRAPAKDYLTDKQINGDGSDKEVGLSDSAAKSIALLKDPSIVQYKTDPTTGEPLKLKVNPDGTYAINSKTGKYINDPVNGKLVQNTPQEQQYALNQARENIKLQVFKKDPRAYEFVNNIEKKWGRPLNATDLGQEALKHAEAGNLNDKDAGAIATYLKYISQFDK